mgnify:CR=1 FL=1
MKKPTLSFVIPTKDEEKSVLPLYEEIIKELMELGNPYEIIFIDDGSVDNTFKELSILSKKDRRVKILQLRGNFGKSVALSVGFDNANGMIIFTMDGDLQDDPKEIPKFLQKINEGYDLVSGWKQKRHDPISKTFPSKVGNFLTRALTGVKIHDLNCGFKAYRREVVNNLNLYGELYKFIPILVAKQNFKVGEVAIRHRERRFGKSKYGWERNTKGFLDLLTVVFLTGYLRRPGHFFGTFGLLSFFIGFLIGSYISFLRITTGSIQNRHPLLLLWMLLMIIGVQLISTGLLAEMVIYSKQKFDYTGTIKEII